jgi:hypothetical protein
MAIVVVVGSSSSSLIRRRRHQIVLGTVAVVGLLSLEVSDNLEINELHRPTTILLNILGQLGLKHSNATQRNSMLCAACVPLYLSAPTSKLPEQYRALDIQRSLGSPVTSTTLTRKPSIWITNIVSVISGHRGHRLTAIVMLEQKRANQSTRHNLYSRLVIK